jgi:hypothetical protein
MAGKKKWTSHEIVGDKTVEVQTGETLGAEPVTNVSVDDLPVSEAPQAAADTPQPPEPEEVLSVQINVHVAAPVLRVERLEQARALLELAKDEPGAPVELAAEGIQAFKSTDGRTMLVVVRDGNLYSQEK